MKPAGPVSSPRSGGASATPVDQNRIDSPLQVLSYLEKRVSGARQRAAKRDWLFGITMAHVREMLTAQGGRCAVSGLDFNFQRFPNSFVKYPFAPSIDRIDPRGGYTPDNVRLVCTAANFGMGDWGDEVLLTIAKGVVDHSSAIPPPDENWITRQQRKIAAAEEIARGLRGKNLENQKRRIAALKRALTLGPTGLRMAAERAHRTRESRRTSSRAP